MTFWYIHYKGIYRKKRRWRNLIGLVWFGLVWFGLLGLNTSATARIIARWWLWWWWWNVSFITSGGNRHRPKTSNLPECSNHVRWPRYLSSNTAGECGSLGSPPQTTPAPSSCTCWASPTVVRWVWFGTWLQVGHLQANTQEQLSNSTSFIYVYVYRIITNKLNRSNETRFSIYRYHQVPRQRVTG